jgi:hypothetical protein
MGEDSAEDLGSSWGSLTEEEEISEPVPRFCIERRCLESAVVVDERLEATTAPAWADRVSARGCLCDALLDACEDEVGEDGRVGAFAEDSADNRTRKVTRERALEEDLDLGD